MFDHLSTDIFREEKGYMHSFLIPDVLETTERDIFLEEKRCMHSFLIPDALETTGCDSRPPGGQQLQDHGSTCVSVGGAGA